jgi:hypothetical protein
MTVDGPRSGRIFAAHDDAVIELVFMIVLPGLPGMALGINLTLGLLTRRKHHCCAVKNPLTNVSTIFHGLHCGAVNLIGW